MKQFIIILCSTVYLCVASFYTFADEIPKGVVIGKSIKKNTLNIRNQDTGNRHTYFLDTKTHILSDGTVLTLNDIEPGHVVFLNFTKTARGRELDLIRIPDLDEFVEMPEIDANEDLFISGMITGVRTIKRTVTIQGPRSNLQRTLHVPTDVKLYDNEKLVKLSSLKIGDLIEFRHHENENGLIVISGKVQKK